MNPRDPKPPAGAIPGQAKPAYVPPMITSYTSEEILKKVGPALTCSPQP